MVSDELYIFVKEREESYLIPLDAYGGLDLRNEIIRRELFDADFAIKLAKISDDNVYCWPERENQDD